MGIFKNKNSILAMLGDQVIVDRLISTGAFEEHGMKIVPKDFVTIDELLKGIKDTKSAGYVFISDTALAGIEDGKYEVIKRIRELYPNIVIAMFFNDEKQDESYKNWAFGYKVYNLYYADENGGFNFSNIAKDLASGEMPLQGENLSEELQAQEQLIKEKEEKLDKKEKELIELQNKLTEIEKLEPNEENSQQVEFLKEQICNIEQAKNEAEKAVQQMRLDHQKEIAEIHNRSEQEKKEYYEKVDKEAKAQIEQIKAVIDAETKPKTPIKRTLGCVTIGVFSISQGAGSTYTAIHIGENLAKSGYPTAVIAYDGKQSLKYAGESYAYFIVPQDEEEKKSLLLETIIKGYTFVIIDFGEIFPISLMGDLIIGNSKITERTNDFGELLRCTYKIAVGFSEPWHIGKIKYFSENEIFDPLSCVYAITGASENKELLKCGLPTCDREIDLINQRVFDWLGLIQEKETKKGFLRKNKESERGVKYNGNI